VHQGGEPRNIRFLIKLNQQSSFRIKIAVFWAVTPCKYKEKGKAIPVTGSEGP
jgi:hypothetical protein